MIQELKPYRDDINRLVSECEVMKGRIGKRNEIEYYTLLLRLLEKKINYVNRLVLIGTPEAAEELISINEHHEKYMGKMNTEDLRRFLTGIKNEVEFHWTKLTCSKWESSL